MKVSKSTEKPWPSIISSLNGSFLSVTVVAADHQQERRHFDFIDQKLEQNDELLIMMLMFAIDLFS